MMAVLEEWLCWCRGGTEDPFVPIGVNKLIL